MQNRVESDRYDPDLADKSLKSKNFFSVGSYDEKTAENYRNSYVAEKRIVSKLSKISIPNLIAQIEDLNEYCVKISRLYLLYFPET